MKPMLSEMRFRSNECNIGQTSFFNSRIGTGVREYNIKLSKYFQSRSAQLVFKSSKKIVACPNSEAEQLQTQSHNNSCSFSHHSQGMVTDTMIKNISFLFMSSFDIRDLNFTENERSRKVGKVARNCILGWPDWAQIH